MTLNRSVGCMAVRHIPARDMMAGLEKGLWDSLKYASYAMLNEVRSKNQVGELLLREILVAFAPEFQKLVTKQ